MILFFKRCSFVASRCPLRPAGHKLCPPRPHDEAHLFRLEISVTPCDFLYKVIVGGGLMIYDDMRQTSVYFSLVSASAAGLFRKPRYSQQLCCGGHLEEHQFSPVLTFWHMSKAAFIFEWPWESREFHHTFRDVTAGSLSATDMLHKHVGAECGRGGGGSRV
jgi:hypothetical protein